jgi:hypothetical protein
MKKTRRFQSLIGKSLSLALAFFAFTQCTTEEPKVEETQVTATETESVINDEDKPVVSLTIDGVHTVLSSIEDCKTCDYVVPENATVVDGKELGIKPGQAICLSDKFHYGNLKLVNLEGTEQHPIVVAYGVKAAETAETTTVN